MIKYLWNKMKEKLQNNEGIVNSEILEALLDLNKRIETLTEITEALVDELKINSESRKMVAKVCKYDRRKTD